jgi:uncharacterized membrane protein
MLVGFANFGYGHDYGYGALAIKVLIQGMCKVCFRGVVHYLKDRLV